MIHLSGGEVALVDPEYYEIVNSYRWYSWYNRRRTHYAATNIYQGEAKTILLMQHLILPVKPGFEVDHADGNGLNNRRANLRYSTYSQNKANRPAPRNNTSGFKGVYKARSGKWTARIMVDYQDRHLGTFADKEDAARAYNEAALEAWGDFAHLNEVGMK